MPEKRVRWVTLVTLAFLFAVGLYGLSIESARIAFDYGIALDGFIFSIVVAVLYFRYEKLNQTFQTFSAAMMIVWLHTIGALYLYGKEWGWLQFDMVMHSIGAFCLALFMYRFVMYEEGLFEERKLRLAAIVILLAFALATANEIVEFLGYGLFNEGSGVFMYGVGDFGEYNDVSWDMISNMFGAVLGTIYSFRFVEGD